MLIDDLKSAQKYIHMEYFIWKADTELQNAADAVACAAGAELLGPAAAAQGSPTVTATEAATAV